MTNDLRDDTICVDFANARLSRNKDMLHTETRALFSYWDELRNGRKLPYRAEVDPREMACDARHLFILESLGEGNIRFRLAGTALVDAFGMELRGMSVRAIMKGKARESMTALVEETLAEPGIGYARLTETGDENAVWEMILLPLKSDFGKADRIIGALHRIEAVEDTGGPANLHFEIKEMTIRPVTATRAEERRFETPNLPAKRAGGFAEQSAGFEGPARLKAIEGGRSAEEQSDRPVKDRPKLRIITNDD